MKLALGLSSSLLLTLVACSSAAPVEETFPPSAGQTGNPVATNPGSGFKPGTPAETPSKPADSLNACATQTAAATPKPVYLVFAYDQSGSMASNSKWTAAGAAMKSFFGSADSKGIKASLTLFPKYACAADSTP